jgi:Flp pilus assembly protein TadD
VRTDPTNLLQDAHRLDREGRWVEAAKAYAALLALQPEFAEAWSDFSGLLLVSGKLEQAKEACHRALDIDPICLGARINLGCILMKQGQWDEAEGYFRRVLAMDPSRNDARLALAGGLMNKGDLESAEAELKRAMTQDPGNLEAHKMLSRILVQRGDLSAACQEIQRLFAWKGVPSCEEERWELSNMSLLFGDMPRGWEQYEARLQRPEGSKPQSHPDHPRWEGGPFVGKTLLVDWEQGLGDTLMFVRYAPLVKALGGRVLWSVQPSLADLVATCPGVDEVIPMGGPLPPFDLHVPLLSLPWVFRTDLTSIPAEIPYLQTPGHVPNRTRLAEVLNASTGRIRIGLAWAGNPVHVRDTERSMPAAVLEPLAALPGVAWHSFHFGPPEDVPLPGVIALAPLLSSFSDTAAVVAAMDLVITVDTALAHLAGALGIPIFLLLHAFPDWRWFLTGQDSPWYPTMRIYRQPHPGDWESVLRQVIADLSVGT